MKSWLALCAIIFKHRSFVEIIATRHCHRRERNRSLWIFNVISNGLVGFRMFNVSLTTSESLFHSFATGRLFCDKQLRRDAFKRLVVNWKTDIDQNQCNSFGLFGRIQKFWTTAVMGHLALCTATKLLRTDAEISFWNVMEASLPSLRTRNHPLSKADMYHRLLETVAKLHRHSFEYFVKVSFESHSTAMINLDTCVSHFTRAALQPCDKRSPFIV